MKKFSIKKLLHNPKYLSNYLEEQEFELYGNYKLIKNEPKYSDYNLTEELIITNNNFKSKRTFLLHTINIIATYVIGLALISIAMDESPFKLIINLHFYLYGLSVFLIPIIPLGLWEILFSKIDKKKTEVDIRLENYNFDVGAYKYYQKSISKEKWLAMSGRDFEIAVAKVFKKNGYEVELTQTSSDGGVDIILKDKNGIIKYVQCKAYKNKVGIAPARELFGVMIANNIKYGISSYLVL